MPLKIKVIRQPVKWSVKKNEEKLYYVAILQDFNGQEINRDHRLFGVMGRGFSEQSAKQKLVQQL